MSAPVSLPHDPASERAVLGCMLLDPECIEDVRDVLTPDDFYAPLRARIFDVVLAVAKIGKGVDHILVESELRARGAWSDDALSELLACTNKIPTEAPAYTARVKKLAVARRLMRTALQVASEGYEPIGDLDDYLDRAESALRVACDQREDNVEVEHISTAVMGVFADWEERSKNPGHLIGRSTGLAKLDQMLAGLQGGKVYVVAGRPGMGKSALAQEFADAVASTGKPVAVFSLEMIAQEWAVRMLSSRSGINSRKITTAEHLMGEDAKKISAAANAVADLPIYLPKTTSLTSQAIRRIARKLHTKTGGLGCIVVDYLQLVTATGKHDNREREISDISRGFKALSMELNVPVVLLSQLNRAVESRTDKRPQLSDLRESGSIEQDADVVIFVYRDEVYKPESADKGLAELIVSKHRGGPTGMVKVAFAKECTRFSTLAEYARPWGDA